jgi:hypothetical protein
VVEQPRRYRNRGSRKIAGLGDDRRGALSDDHPARSSDSLRSFRPMLQVQIRARLLELAQERFAAEDVGLDADPSYMADLEAEVLEYRLALAQAQITEIAMLRGELFGRDVG